jgi:hypothetical protein
MTEKATVAGARSVPNEAVPNEAVPNEADQMVRRGQVLGP